jgi:DNA-binding MarR family transcriptional regulator
MQRYPGIERDAMLALSEAARLLKTHIDRRAAEHGITRAQWAVLKRIEEREGLKQTDLADQLDLQPISLVHLIDKLCEQGLIERRRDPIDRRANRLFILAAGRRRLDDFAPLAKEIMTEVFAGFTPETTTDLLRQLTLLKDNIKRASEKPSDAVSTHLEVSEHAR